MSSAVGRPRDPAKDVAVLHAARELLVEHGYQGTTMVAVAKRAGVGAPTLYRRWPTKESLVEDAAFGHTTVSVPPTTGDLYADLRGWVAMFLDWLADPVTRAALPGLLTAYHRDESIYERLVLRSEADVRALLGELIGGDTGRTDVVFDFLVAATVVRAMTRGLVGKDEFCDRTAAALTALAQSTHPAG